jgi:hypothetical protein
VATAPTNELEDAAPVDNVVPFKVVASNLEEPVGLPPEKQATYDAVLRFANFLVENAENIDYFVAVVAARTSADVAAERTAIHVITPPIHANDFAFAIKKLEHTFFANLGDMGEEF